MNVKSRLLILLLLMPTCVQFEFDKAALEESIFGQLLSNQSAVHDHDAHDHEVASAPELAVEETAALQVVLVPSQLVVGPNRMAVGLLDGNEQMIHAPLYPRRCWPLMG